MGIYTDKAESALKKAQRFSARMHHPIYGNRTYTDGTAG